jgi:hypothetical protein
VGDGVDYCRFRDGRRNGTATAYNRGMDTRNRFRNHATIASC